MKRISFIILNYNTKDYTEWSYNHLRKNLGYVDEIIMLDDGSTDGTWELLQKLKNSDPNMVIHRNEKNIGMAYSYNKGVELSSNEIVCGLHTDMYLPPRFNDIMLKYMEDYDFITSLRVEPNVYPDSVDKIQEEFGRTKDEFNEHKFLEWLSNNEIENKGRVEQRMFFPWMCTKSLYQEIGGNDTLFLKYMIEDDDFYLRVKMSGAKYTQVFETAVYHIPSRSTKYKGDIVNEQGSDDWNYQYAKSAKNFYRKWGVGAHQVWDDITRDMVIPNKYDIGLVIKNCNQDFLKALELLCSTIYVDCDFDGYIKKEQTETMLDMNKRVCSIHAEKQNDIIVKFDGNKFNQQHYNFLQQFSEILSDSGEIGDMKWDIFDIQIKSLQTNNSELINNNRYLLWDK